MKMLTRRRRWILGLTATGLAATGVAAGVANAATPAANGQHVRNVLRVERRLAVGSVRGEIVLNTKKGLKTLDFQRGTISAASSTGFTLTDAGGTAQNWAMSSSTEVRARKGNASSSTSAAIVDGETAIVIGAKTDGALTARTVVVVPAGGATPQVTG